MSGNPELERGVEGGPLTRIELAIVLGVIVILALIITSSLAGAGRKSAGAPQLNLGNLPQAPVPTLSTALQAGVVGHFSTGALAVAGAPGPMASLNSAGVSNSLTDSTGFFGLTNQDAVDWLRSLENGGALK